MPETVWYRSIYWRIAFGFVALLAVLLGTQALVFLWMTGRMSELVPGRSPAELAQTIALDLERALPENPALNLDEYLNSRYSSLYRGWVVVTRDNRAVFSRVVPPMPNAAGAVRGRLFDLIHRKMRNALRRVDADGHPKFVCRRDHFPDRVYRSK